MAKNKSFDPDALAKAGQDIAKKHQVREAVTPKTVATTPVAAPAAPAPKKRGRQTDEKTQLCRVGISFHRRVKFAAVRKDMTIRQYLEELIEEHVPKE